MGSQREFRLLAGLSPPLWMLQFFESCRRVTFPRSIQISVQLMQCYVSGPVEQIKAKATDSIVFTGLSLLLHQDCKREGPAFMFPPLPTGLSHGTALREFGCPSEPYNFPVHEFSASINGPASSVNYFFDTELENVLTGRRGLARLPIPLLLS